MPDFVLKGKHPRTVPFGVLLAALFSIVSAASCFAQLAYDAVAAYGLRKIVPTYTGSAIQVRRACDNATANIGYTSCGDLDTVSLKTFVMAANPLTQISSTAAAVYSLRKMRCAYAGSAIRVRSTAAGSPTMDIGFTSAGDLDTAALKTFVGANSAFVTIWYDQSGNAYDAAQATAAAQPRIVNAGVVDRQNNRPAIYFNGNAGGNVLLNSGYSMLLDNQTPTWNAVVVPQTPTDVYSAIVCWRYAGGVESALEFGPGGNWNTSWWSNTNYNLTNGTSVSYSVCQILTSLYSATSNQMYVNGTLSFNNTGQSNTAAISTNPNGCAATGLRIGNDNCCGGRFVKGYIIEIVMAPSNFSATDRQYLEWSQAQYYNVSGPVLSTLPASPASASVTTWYDQSGAAKDAVQATATNQPRIINAGAIEKNGSIPAMSFAGATQNIVAPLSTSAYPVTIALAANTSGASTNGAFVKLGTSVNGGQAGVAVGIGNSGGTFDAAGTSVLALKEWVVWSPSNPNVNYPATPFVTSLIQQSGGGGTNIYLNGTNIPLSNAATAVSASIAGSLAIGGYNNGTNRYAAVKESEVIVYGSALSATRRTLLETHQSAYNSITVSTNKYTPPGASAYRLYVNGVGRESSTDSVAGTRSTTGMGFIIGQTGSDFLKDNGDYLTIGMNCPVSAAVSTLNLPATVVQRWNNDWYLNKTDVGTNNGTINFFFDFSDYGVSGSPGTAANYELLARSSAAGNFSIVAGTTKSVVGDRVMFAVDAANITTNYYYTIGTKSISVSPLPIELESFEANCSGDKAQLKWVVASQHNNAYFTVERTDNGQDFKTVGTVKGAGTTPQKITYNYTDDDPLPGLSYYRLKQTDFGGTERYYGLRQALCDPEKEIRIYPNPTANKLTIEMNALQGGTILTISNALGQLLYSTVYSGPKQEIDLSLFVKGLYYLKLEGTQGARAVKILKE